MLKWVVAGVCMGLAGQALSPCAVAQPAPGKATTTAPGTQAAGAPKAASAPKAQSAPQAKSAPKKPTGPATVRRAPPPPAALLPAAIETRIEAGCLDEPVLHNLALPVDTTLPGLEQVALMAAEPGSPPPCHVYSAALTGQVSTLLVMQPDREGDKPEVLLVTSEPGRELIVARREDFSAPGQPQRELRLVAGTLEEQPAEAIAAVPSHLNWELEQLLRAFTAHAVAPESHHVRLVLAVPDASAPERIAALELIEATSNTPVDSIVWQAREDQPGAYVSRSGVEYERVLWQSPVKHERISRGVGPSSATVTRRVTRPAKDGGKPEVVHRRVRYVGHHIGIDFVAARGTPVHAVAEATVAYVGSKPGYGKMVILDHGAGYQTYYAHLHAFAKGLKAGTRLGRGEVLGQVGSTGISTGPHLHYEVRKHGEYIDILDASSRLSFWNLAYEEHPAFLTRVMSLELTRPVSSESARGAWGS